VSYPEPEEELEIVNRAAVIAFNPRETTPLAPVLDMNNLMQLRMAADTIHIDRRIAEYIVSIVTATRPAVTRLVQSETGKLLSGGEGLYRYLSFGASVRSSIALHKCSRIRALFEGRSFVSPEDVKIAAIPVLRHRLVLSYEAEAEGLNADAVITRILSHVPVP